MSTYPVAEPYGACAEVVDSTFGLYLGALASNPVTTVNGTYYWNTALNIFRVWDDVQWNDVTPEQFDGIVNGGSVTRIDTIQVRGDTATNWTNANPVLLVREIGLETDTKYFKFGDGTTAWNSLTYPGLPKSRITGIENVDNTSDVNKPVSTLQVAADLNTLNTAKAYTDSELNTAIVGEIADDIIASLATANAYTLAQKNILDVSIASAITTANTYTDSELTIAIAGEIADDIAASLVTANAYTDAREVNIEAQIAASLVTAEAYTDATAVGLIKDMGTYDPSITNQFPTGTILKGYTYIYSNTGTQGSVTVSAGDQVRAKINTPGQTEANWLITPKFDSSTKPYIVSMSPVYGRPLANAICVSHEFVMTVVFPINLTGSKALVKTTKKATNTATFIIKKNDIQIGTVVFTSASTQGTFTFTNAVTFNSGDVLDVYAPSPADATLADIIISLYGTR
jgi:hypothetical protein